MEDKTMVGAEEVHQHEGCENCPQCQARQKQDADNDEISFAFLLSLLPVITLTLFGNMGLL